MVENHVVPMVPVCERLGRPLQFKAPNKACLHVPSPCPSPSPSKYNITPVVTVRLTGRKGTEPTLFIGTLVA